MAKNKQSTLAELVADSEPVRKEIQVGNHSIIITELTGRDRYQLAELGEQNRWDTILWVCSKGIVEPHIGSVEELEFIRPAWLTEIGTEILALSGLQEDALEEAENA